MDLLDQGHAQTIDLRSTDDVKPLSSRGFLKGLLKAMNDRCAFDAVIPLPRKDDRFAAWEQPTDALVGFASHEERVSHRQAFETHQIRPEFPWQSIFDTDRPIASHGHDQAQSLRIRTRVI